MIKTILKISFTIFLITYLLLYAVDLSKALKIVAGTNLIFFSLAYLVNLSGIMLSIFRWKGILNVRSIKIKFLRLLSYYFIGIFYNNFIPGAIGGDTVKMYKMSKEVSQNKTALVTSVIIDRYVGLIIVYFTAVIVFFIGYPGYSNRIRTLFLIVIFSYSFFILLFSSKRTFNYIFHFLTGWIRLKLKIIQKIHDIYDSINLLGELSQKKKDAFKIILPSLGFFFFAYIGEIYLLLFALDCPVKYTELLSFIPVLNLIVMLPVSIGGLGIREFMFIFFLGEKGIPAEAALSLCILLLCFRIFNSLIGATLNLIKTDN